jgi:hypothetical protein
MSEILHSWSRSPAENVPDPAGYGGEFDLAPGSYSLASDMPTILQRRTSYTPAVTGQVLGEMHGEVRGHHLQEVEPAVSEWEDFSTGGSSFNVVEKSTYRVRFPHGGKGHVTLSTN